MSDVLVQNLARVGQLLLERAAEGEVLAVSTPVKQKKEEPILTVMAKSTRKSRAVVRTHQLELKEESSFAKLAHNLTGVALRGMAVSGESLAVEFSHLPTNNWFLLHITICYILQSVC